MSDSRNCISDYMGGVPMEIGEAFFPPPVLVLPPPPQPPPQFQQYDYSAETSATTAYAKFMEWKMTEESSKTIKQPLSSSGPAVGDGRIPTDTGEVSWSGDSMTKLSLGPGTTDISQRSTHSDSFIKPMPPGSVNYSIAGHSQDPLPAIPSSSGLPRAIMSNLGQPLTPWTGQGASGSGILEPQPFQGHQRRPSTEQNSRTQRLVSLEDFESSASPFDALEIKTIDDRALLRQVLDSR